MINSRFALLVFIFANFSLAVPTIAMATPIPGATAQVNTGVVDSSGAQTEQFTITDGASGSSSLTSSASTASASGNLSTGILRVNTQGTTAPGATVSAYDFLTFNGNGTVSYSLAITGSLNNAAPDGDVSIGGAIYVYNVTGATSDVFTINSNPPNSEYINTGYVPAASSGQTVDVYGPSYPSGDLPITFGNFTVSTDQNDSGNAIPVTVDATGSIDVVAGDVYAIQLLLTGGADQLGGTIDEQGANFADTAAFSFTNLDGLTYSSASGEFLASVPASVPEPGTLGLFGAGLIGVAGFASQRLKRKVFRS